MNGKPQLYYKVSIIHTCIFFFICIFFTVIALIWELRQRYHFHIYIKPKKLPDEILLSTLHDFNTFITCSDPYILYVLSVENVLHAVILMQLFWNTTALVFILYDAWDAGYAFLHALLAYAHLLRKVLGKHNKRPTLAHYTKTI